MRKALGFVAATLLFAGPALGADLGQPGGQPAPYKAPPPSPVFSWTGFYVGGHGGYGFTETTPRLQGGFGGGQIGYNYQVNNFLVVGIEGDGAGGDIMESTPTLGATIKLSDRALVSARGRVGLALGNVLLYGTGGGGWASATASGSGFGVTLSQTRWLSGWTGGAGIEYAFAPNWSAKVEYLRYGFGAQTFQALGGGAALLVTLPTFNIDTAKVGINYRF